MSQEEHILHTLKEMREWTAHADRQLSRIKWTLYGLAAILVITLLLVVCRSACAGPMDNAQQFQKRTMQSAVKNQQAKKVSPGMKMVPADKVKDIDLSEYVNTGSAGFVSVKDQKDDSVFTVR